MQLPFFTAWKIQLGLNIVLILAILLICFTIIKLILGVRGKKINDEEKRKKIKKLIITSIIFVSLFALINIFFEIDPLNLIEDAVDGVYLEIFE